MTLYGSWPVDHPDGIVLRLWTDRDDQCVDLTADELDGLARLLVAREDGPFEWLSTDYETHTYQLRQRDGGAHR